MSPANEGNYEAIGRETYERYLLDLMRECAKEEERLYQELHGEPLPHEIREIQLAGDSSPHPGFTFRTYDRKQDLEQTGMHLLYENPQFYDKDGNRLVETDRIVGDILMWERGG